MRTGLVCRTKVPYFFKFIQSTVACGGNGHKDLGVSRLCMVECPISDLDRLPEWQVNLVTSYL